MPKHFKTEHTISDKGAPGNCSTWLGMLQIVLGVLLVTASMFSYSLMHSTPR